MITINKAPQLYTTLNLALFQISSDRPTILTFKVEVLDGVTSAVMAVQKYATLPMLPLGTYFDLAPLLSSFVDHQIITSQDVLSPVPSLSKSYKLRITEIYLDAFGAQQIGSVLNTAVYNVINTTLSRAAFRVFDYKKYVHTPTFVGSKFLSLAPLVKNIYYDSKEYLYLLSHGDFMVKINFYRQGGILVGTQETTQTVTTTKGFRINLSPGDLDAVYGDSLLNMYGHQFSNVFTVQFGSSHNINDANYFTVQILNAVNLVPIGELRTYAMRAISCRKTMVEVMFSNSLGGVDTMAFMEPKQTVSRQASTIETNTYSYNAGNFSDLTDGLFNAAEKVVKSKIVSSFSLISEPLTDLTSVYSQALIESDNVYVKMTTGDLLPVSLAPQDYAISKRKYSTNNVRLSINFKVADVNFVL